MNEHLILGIETSCDDTAAAVYSNKRGMLSSVLFSQFALHRNFGGIMPEVASRSHLERINFIVQQALDTAQVTLNNIDAVAVTSKPGLPGSLLIGVCFAKAIAWAGNKKLIGINHLEGHAFSACIENDVPFPHLCITASGGHTSLYLVHDYGSYTILGQTTDDAAGEAFDKIARMMNYPYPGGPIIEKLAGQAGFIDYFKYPRQKQKTLDFSFSGLKTAVLYDLVKKDAYDMAAKKFLKDSDETLKQQVASSLLICVADVFLAKIKFALSLYPQAKALTFVGGVACNSYIKGRLRDYCSKNQLAFYAPSPKYCTDNAGMIAFVGNYKAQKGEFSGLDLDIF